MVKPSIYCFYCDFNFMSNDRFNPREMIERFMELWKKIISTISIKYTIKI